MSNTHSASASASAVHSTSTAATPVSKRNQQLPNTGDRTSVSNIGLGIMSALAGLGILAKKRKRDEEEE